MDNLLKNPLFLFGSTTLLYFILVKNKNKTTDSIYEVAVCSI